MFVVVSGEKLCEVRELEGEIERGFGWVLAGALRGRRRRRLDG